MTATTETAEAQLRAAADQIRSMGREEFEEKFSHLLDRLQTVDNRNDGLRVDFALDPDYGIEMYRAVHIRVIEGGGFCTIESRLRDDAAEPDWERCSLTTTMAVDTTPSPEQAWPAFYAVFREAADATRPDLLFGTDVKVHLEAKDDEFSIFFET